jgi:hypothetical protein
MIRRHAFIISGIALPWRDVVFTLVGGIIMIATLLALMAIGAGA